jgi:protein-L-isoaspartate(D-aspartate) O-methyltransferase
MTNRYDLARKSMIETQLVPRGIHDPRVIQAMANIPRERFVDAHLRSHAYDDCPLPIKEDQTISQPYIVALMTQALELTGHEKTLEIGTGSGYQTAILAELCESVYTIERIGPLLEKAKKTLNELGYINIYYKIFNGTLGWSEHASYDAIIVTAAAPRIPKPLVKQLKEKGRLVVPVGDRISQELIEVIKRDGAFFTKSLGGVRFVSLVGEHGWSEQGTI